MPLPEVCFENRKERPVEDAQKSIDAPSQTRADSARVGGKYKKPDSKATKAAFDALNSILDGLAEQVVFTIDQIIPHLAEMQSLLSQRGKARKKVLDAAGLPSWPEYGKAYADKLECSFRTIQDHITGLRRNGKSGPSQSAECGQQRKRPVKRSKPWHADAKDSRALADAQLAINDFVAAYEAGAELAPAYERYRKVAVSPNKLVSILDAATGGSSNADIEAEVKRKLVLVVEAAQRYIHALERFVPTEELRGALKKPKEEWRSILRFGRGVHAERTGKGVPTEAAPVVLKEVA